MDYEFVMVSHILRPRVKKDFDFDDSVRIGQGAYGQVFKARDKINYTMQFYALKEVDLTGLSLATFREISLYRELKHRNIIDLHKVYFSQSEQKAWLLFDYADYDLHYLIKHYRHHKPQEVRIPIVTQKSCIYQILKGVQYLHDNWILHRDLKPENIMVMGKGPNNGCIKIADLGMARTFNSPIKPLGDVDAVVVTSWYRAPELLLGARHYTKAIDIFSIGCIFGELLTNVPLFYTHPDRLKPARSPYQRNQLDTIFTVLGYPKDIYELFSECPEYFRMIREINKTNYKGCSILKFLKSYKIPRDDVNLLSSLIAFDAQKRITIEKALEHKYFHKKPFPMADIFSDTNSITIPHRPFIMKKIQPPKIQPPNIEANIDAKRARPIFRQTYLQEINV